MTLPKASMLFMISHNGTATPLAFRPDFTAHNIIYFILDLRNLHTVCHFGMDGLPIKLEPLIILDGLSAFATIRDI